MATGKRRRWPWVLLVIAVVLAGFYGWAFVSAPDPAKGYAINLAEVRKLATSIPGDLPSQVRVERVCDFQFPAAVGMTGKGWGMLPMTVFSYEAVYPDHVAIIDAALTQPIPGGTMNLEALDRMSKAMSKASLIVITHEHMDHIGGLVGQPNFKDLLKVTKLNPEQTQHPELMDPAKFPEGSMAGYQPLAYEKYAAVAPGMVLIRSPGHTPGSQLVYLKLATGTEYLFLGDVAWRDDNVTDQKGRPRLLGKVMHEDTAMVLAELAELHRLRQEAPEVHQLCGHDPGPVNALVSQHLLEEKF